MIFCIDLDGTLIKNDMSVTSFKDIVKAKPLMLFKCAYWLVKGTRSLTKFKLGEIYEFDVEKLNYNQNLIKYLRDLAKDSNNKFYLVSGSTQSVVSKIATHFEFFEEGFGSSPTVNLTGKNKLAFIRKQFGSENICYAGNSRVDFKVWSGGIEAIVVSDSDDFINRAKSITNVKQVFKNSWNNTDK